MSSKYHVRLFLENAGRIITQKVVERTKTARQCFAVCCDGKRVNHSIRGMAKEHSNFFDCNSVATFIDNLDAESFALGDDIGIDIRNLWSDADYSSVSPVLPNTMKSAANTSKAKKDNCKLFVCCHNISLRKLDLPTIITAIIADFITRSDFAFFRRAAIRTKRKCEIHVVAISNSNHPIPTAFIHANQCNFVASFFIYFGCPRIITIRSCRLRFCAWGWHFLRSNYGTDKD